MYTSVMNPAVLALQKAAVRHICTDRCDGAKVTPRQRVGVSLHSFIMNPQVHTYISERMQQMLSHFSAIAELNKSSSCLKFKIILRPFVQQNISLASQPYRTDVFKRHFEFKDPLQLKLHPLDIKCK